MNVNVTAIVSNSDLFTLPTAAVTAGRVVEQLEQLQEDIGGAPPPLSAEGLGHQLYNRVVKRGSAPTAAELADLADDSRGEAARRAYDAVAAAVHDAREAFERSVRAGAADYLEQLRGAWGALLNEVKAAGDLPATPEEAVHQNDVEGYQRLMTLVQRADRIRSLHRDLLGELRSELRGGCFLDSLEPPDRSEIANVGRRMVQPAGPSDPARRLKWLSSAEAYLAPDAKTAGRAFDEWYRSLTNIPMDGKAQPPSVRLGR